MMRTDCLEFEARIQELLDDRRMLTDDSSLQGHRTTCSRCRAMFDAYVSLIALMQARSACGEWADRAPGTNDRYPVKTSLVSANTDSASSTIQSRLDSGRDASEWHPLPASRYHRYGRVAWVLGFVAATVLLLALPLLDSQRGFEPVRDVALRPPQTSPSSIAIPWTACPGERADGLTPQQAIARDTQALKEQAQQLLTTIEGIPSNLEGIETYCLCTASLSGVSTITSSVNLTVDILRRRWSTPAPSNAPPAAPAPNDNSLRIVGPTHIA